MLSLHSFWFWIVFFFSFWILLNAKILLEILNASPARGETDIYCGAVLGQYVHPRPWLWLDPEYQAALTHLLASGPGFSRPWALASHTLLATSLPMEDRTLMSSNGHSSKSRDRTLDRWVPKFLWIPEHSMQMRAPRLRLAQSGSVAARMTNINNQPGNNM